MQDKMFDVLSPKEVLEYFDNKNILFSPVVAISIFDNKTTPNGVITPHSKILAGVRRPETNLSDPNVISMPTHRIPQEFLQALIDDLEMKHIEVRDEQSPYKRVYIQWTRKPKKNRVNTPDMSLYIAKSLLSSKLGVSEAMHSEYQHLKIVHVEPRVSIFGQVHGTNEDPVHGTEMIHMLGIGVHVEFDENPFPNETTSYSSIQFMDADEFASLVDSKDPHIMSKFGDFAQVCIRGLCVRTAQEQIYPGGKK